MRPEPPPFRSRRATRAATPDDGRPAAVGRSVALSPIMIQSGGDHPVRTETTDVLIAGAGPAGLTLTALLARAGVKAITVSRWPGTAHTAHITN